MLSDNDFLYALCVKYLTVFQRRLYNILNDL